MNFPGKSRKFPDFPGKEHLLENWLIYIKRYLLYSMTITGGGADMFLSPGTSFMSIGGGAAQGLARTALKEHAESAGTVTEVSSSSNICEIIGGT